jgi:transposase InsO family protein
MVGLARSSYHYEPRVQELDDPMAPLIRHLAMKFTRYGYRRITAVLRRAGGKINHKRVYRIWKEQALILPRKKPRKRRLWFLNDRAHSARRRNEVWSYDFVFDQDVLGERLKFLPVIDEYTKEALKIPVGSNFTSKEVRQTLAELFSKYGKPKYLRSDNGPEFVCKELRQWLLSQGVKPIFIEKGHPWENGFVESFNGKFRDECLNGELFWGVAEANWVAEKFRKYYNQFRPHMALKYKTPAEVGQRPADPPAGLN